MHEPGMAALSSDPSTQEVEAVWSQVQGHPQLYSLPSLKKKEYKIIILAIRTM